MSEQFSELPLSQLRAMLSTMFRIRAFEEKVDELFMRGEMHGTTHLSIGQEGTAVGAVAALGLTVSVVVTCCLQIFFMAFHQISSMVVRGSKLLIK